MTDDDRRALNAIYRIIHHDQNADAAVLAREILTVLRGHGWRPTPAGPAPDWQHRDVPPAPPNPEYLAARPSSRGRTDGT